MKAFADSFRYRSKLNVYVYHDNYSIYNYPTLGSSSTVTIVALSTVVY